MKKLAIVSTHPIQYYAPVFKELSRHEINVKVFYTWGKDSISKFDPDFQRKVEWDIPLLEGYEYTFLTNSSSKPGTSHFRGIINPDAFTKIDEFHPDAILVYGWAWQSHLQIIKHYAKRCKVWFRGDSTLLDQSKGIRNIVRNVLLRWVYKHIDLAFYVGTFNKQYFQSFGLKDQQLRFAPHSVDNQRFSQSQKELASQIRLKLGIPENAILVLFAGKLEPKKDPSILLEAFLNIEGENVYLLFVGNGVLEAKLKSKALASAKANKIFFLDFQNQGEMPAVYQCCQLFCLPSVGPGETWGLAVNEAMAAGKPVLVSDKVGCSVDLIQQEVNGCVFEAANVKDLSNKLARLTGDLGKLNRMAKESVKIIEKWSFSCQIAPILEEVKKL